MDCNSERPNGTTTIFTKNDPKESTKDELENEMNSFTEIKCASCGEVGKWIINSLDFKGKVKVLKQFKLNIVKENHKTVGSPDDNYLSAEIFSSEQLQEIYRKIRSSIIEFTGHYLPPKPNGKALFTVVVTDEAPYIRLSEHHSSGVSADELIQHIDHLSGIKTEKGISGELNKKLEIAFDDLKENQSNPLVIAHLQSKDRLINFYIIAKLPDSDIYYGIMENEFTEFKIIEGIPLVNFEPLNLIEVPVTPFRTQEYIVNGIKSDE
jgi:hypothetical protein